MQIASADTGSDSFVARTPVETGSASAVSPRRRVGAAIRLDVSSALLLGPLRRPILDLEPQQSRTRTTSRATMDAYKEPSESREI